MKRFFALIVSCSVVLSMLVPFAYASDISSQPVTYWDKFLYFMINPSDESGFEFGPINIDIRSIRGQIYSTLSSNLCPNSEDNLHHVHHFLNQSGEDSHGRYELASCQFCDADFKVYGEDVHDAYDNYLHDNGLDNDIYVSPSSGTGSGYYVSVPISGIGMYLNTYHVFYPFSDSFPIVNNGFDLSPFSVSIKSRSASSVSFRTSYPPQSYNGCGPPMGQFYIWRVPSPGTISSVSAPRMTGTNTVDVDHFSQFDSINNLFSNVFGLSDSYYITSSYVCFFSCRNDAFTSGSSYRCPNIKFLFTPSSGNFVPSVPSNITINNNSYPVTSFNFCTRTFISDNNTKIEYGDTAIKIYNGDSVIQTINYYIENNGSGDSGGGSGDSGGGSGSGSSIDYTNILNQIKDLLSQILAAIGIENNTVSIPADDLPEAVDEEQEIPGFFSSIVSKFLWINDLYHVILHLFQDISNDSISAQAVSQGIIPISDLSPDHSSGTDDPVPDNSVQESNSSVRGMTKSQYTAPAISFYFPDVEIYGFSFGGYQVMDFSWYAPYKSQVDAILSGFMLIGFLVWVFHRAPEIIRGGAATQSTLGKFESYNEGFVDPQARWWT